MKKPKAEKNKISLWAKIKSLFDNSPWHCAFTYPILYILGITISSSFLLNSNYSNNNEEPGLLFNIGVFMMVTIYLTPIWVLIGLIISKRRLPYILSLIIGLVIPSIIFVVAYNSFTASAKASATKSIQAEVIKFVNSELEKCRSGEKIIIFNKLTCSEKTNQAIVTAAVSALTVFKNPYITSEVAVTNGGNNTADSDVGYIRLIPSVKEIIVKSCFRTPCKKEQNRNQHIVKFN